MDTVSGGSKASRETAGGSCADIDLIVAPRYQIDSRKFRTRRMDLLSRFFFFFLIFNRHSFLFLARRAEFQFGFVG